MLVGGVPELLRRIDHTRSVLLSELWRLPSRNVVSACLPLLPSMCRVACRFSPLPLLRRAYRCDSLSGPSLLWRAVCVVATVVTNHPLNTLSSPPLSRGGSPLGLTGHPQW